MNGDFDFLDFKVPQTIYLRLGETGLFAVFNDSSGALTRFMPVLNRITVPVSDLQAREIAAELASLNLHINHRPQFHSKWHLAEEWIRAEAELPKRLELVPIDSNVFGEIRSAAFSNILPELRLQGLAPNEVSDLMRAGRLSFLFDNDGNFIANGRVPEVEP